MGDKNKALKDDVLDLLNQIMVKLKDVGEPLTEESDYGTVVVTECDQEVYNRDTDEYEMIPVPDFDANLQYLACVKQMLSRAVEGNLYDVAYNEKQYYTSNC